MSRPLKEAEDTTLRPSWLVRHAEQLVSRVSGTDLPRTAHPRRAVSAAYYAAFHRVVLEVAYSAAPQAGRDAWFPMCRGFLHDGVGKVCGWLTGNPCPTSVRGLVAVARESRHLVDFGRLFVLLRQEREWADYSHEVVINGHAALTMIELGRSAIAAVDEVSSDDPAWQAFVALMLMESKPRSYAMPTKDEAGL